MKTKLLLFLAALFCAIPSFALNKNTNFAWELAALGNQPALTQVFLNGNNGAITTTFEPLWPESAAYTVLAVDMSSPYVASADANDTSAATGARTVTITCVSAAGAETATTYSLNGQTSVPLTQTCRVINKIEVITAGSGGSNAGVIRVGTGSNSSGVPAVVHGHVAIGFNQSQSFIYMVPANYTLVCRNFTAGSLSTTAANAHRFVIDRYVSLGILKREELISGETGGSNPGTLPSLKKFAEKSVVVGQALGATSTGPVTLSAECLKVNNDWINQPESIF